VGSGTVTRTEPLARTGGSQAMLLTIGLLMLLAGAGLTAIARRATRRA
jgi:LPXTG-motif cell wall-anchored protein